MSLIKVSKELHPLEEALYIVSKKGDGCVDSIGITNAKDIILGDDIIKQALFYLYKRHPLFRAHIHVDTVTGKPCFAIPNDEKSKDEMKYERYKVASRDEFISHMEKDNTKLLDYENKCLLWRFVLYEFKQDDDYMYAFVLILPMHMTDGINIVVLCMEMFNIVNSLLQNQTCKEMTEKLELLDSIAELIEKHGLKAKESEQDNHHLMAPFKVMNKLKNLEDDEFKTTLFAFDVETTKKIIGKAKSHKIKLTSLLTVAMFYAFKQLYEENGIVMPKDTSVSIPVNMRFRFKPQIDLSHVRMCVGYFILDLLYPKFGKYENMIEESKYVDSIISSKIENLEMLKPFNDNSTGDLNNLYRGNIIDLNTFIEISDNHRNTDVALSNIGTYASNGKHLVDGPLKIDEMYFGDILKSKQSTFEPLTLYTLTFNNRLMVRLSSQRHQFAAKHVDRFIQLFEQQLKHFVSN